MDFSDVNELFKDDLARVEAVLKENYSSDIPLVPGIGSYIMNGGGKRVRPLLLLISARLCGGVVDERTIQHCGVVEYVHAATLLHDDVVDETTVRRGNETVNSKWGNDASILIGDFLLTRAIVQLAEYNTLPIFKAFAQAAKLLVEGGLLEFTNVRDIQVSEAHCLDVIRRKTAALMSLSCQLGAMLVEADKQWEEALVAFGNNFGMAFQLADDALDYGATQEVLGKPPGNDFKEGHVTLPLLYLYQNSQPGLKREIEQFIQNDKVTDKELEYIVDRMRDSKAIEYTMDKANGYMNQARKVLQDTSFKAPEYRDSLIAVANHIIDRYSPTKPTLTPSV